MTRPSASTLGNTTAVLGADAEPGIVQWLTSRAFYRQANFDQLSSFATLAQPIAEFEQKDTGRG